MDSDDDVDPNDVEVAVGRDVEVVVGRAFVGDPNVFFEEALVLAFVDPRRAFVEGQVEVLVVGEVEVVGVQDRDTSLLLEPLPLRSCHRSQLHP